MGQRPVLPCTLTSTNIDSLLPTPPLNRVTLISQLRRPLAAEVVAQTENGHAQWLHHEFLLAMYPPLAKLELTCRTSTRTSTRFSSSSRTQCSRGFASRLERLPPAPGPGPESRNFQPDETVTPSPGPLAGSKSASLLANCSPLRPVRRRSGQNHDAGLPGQFKVATRTASFALRGSREFRWLLQELT
eukprot:3591423-Rhodomonas_salina.2